MLPITTAAINILALSEEITLIPTLQDGSSCLVIKESYGNAFVPFLVDHYQTVHVVDYRYFGENIPWFVEENQVQDVIFLNNADAISESAVSYMDGLFQ